MHKKYSKHLSDRQNNEQSKGSHKICSLCGLVPSQKTDRKKSSEAEEVVEGEEKGGKVEGLPTTPNDKPLGNIGESGDGANRAAAPLLGANLLHSSIYKHQLPQKSGCLLSINRNHSPMVHLIMRPHTELRLDAAHHCLGQPASNPGSRPTPAPTPAHRLQASHGLKEEGARCEAADPPAPTGLLNE